MAQSTELPATVLADVRGAGAYAAGQSSYLTAGTFGEYKRQRNEYGLLGRAMFSLGFWSAAGL